MPSKVHQAHRLAAALGVMSALAGAGCWEEIRHHPQPAKVEPADDPPPANDPPLELPAPPTAKAIKPTLPPLAPTASDLFSPEPETERDASSPQATPPTPAVEESVDPPAIEPAPAIESVTDVTPVSPAQRRHAWTAASKWSLAAAIHAKGLDAAKYQPILADATAAAAAIGVELPPWPVGDAHNLEATIIAALRGEPANALVESLSRELSPSEGAAAELAIRSHLLLLTYSSRSSAAAAQANSLRKAAEASELPAEVWEPLAKLLDDRAEFLAVRQAVFDLHRRAAAHLDDAAEKSPSLEGRG